MRGVVMYAPGDVRVEDRPETRSSQKPTDAIIRLSATCICGSDLWPYRGADPVGGPIPMGHEYVGIVEEVGVRGHHDQARPVRRRVVLRLRQHLRDLPGRLPVLVRPSRDPRHRGGAQAQRMRVPLADGTLVATPDVPPADLVPDFLAASDVLGTGWFGAVAADAGPGKTVAVVGDGAVGLLRRAGRPATRRRTDHRDEPPRSPPAAGAGVRRHRHRRRTRRRGRRTDQGAHRRVRRALVIEAVGTQESMMQAIRSTRPGGHVGYVGVTHDVALPGDELFMSPRAPARRARPRPPLPARPDGPHLAPKHQPGKVFDLELPLDDAASGYRAMDTRQATKVLLRP